MIQENEKIHGTRLRVLGENTHIHLTKNKEEAKEAKAGKAKEDTTIQVVNPRKMRVSRWLRRKNARTKDAEPTMGDRQ